MAELDLLNQENQKVGTVELSPDVFDVKVREKLVQKYVTRQLAARRRGTAATKRDKGELHGSGRKPWRQKGTGRARAGDSRSPLWRGGMTVFGPTPRSYAFKMSKKSRKLALKSILTDRAKHQMISVVEKLELEEPRTKKAVEMIRTLGLPEKTLFILAEKNRNLELGVRNIPHVDVLPVEGLNAFDLLVHEKIVCTPESL